MRTAAGNVPCHSLYVRAASCIAAENTADIEPVSSQA